MKQNEQNLNIQVIQMRADSQQIFWAKETAKRLFKKYNYQGGELQQYELSSLLDQTYGYLNIPFKSTPNDVKSYGRVLDQNRDGRVTLEDLQAVCIKYLCGDSVKVPNSSYPGNAKPPQQQFQAPSYTSITTQQYKPSSPPNYQQSYQQNQQAYTNQRKQTNSSSINYTVDSNQYSQSSYQNYQQNIYNQSSNNQQATPLQAINTEGLLSHQLTRGGSKQIFDQYSQQNSEYPQDYPERSQYGNSVRQSYTQSQQQQSNQKVLGSTPQALLMADQVDPGQTYTKQVLRYLKIVHDIFFSHCLPDQTITEAEVPAVLSETYEALGRSGYVPTQEDVRVWMRLCDGDEDGHVQYEQYEYFVIRSLERSGITIYNP